MKKHGKVAIISRESNTRTPDIAMLEAELAGRGADVTVLSRLLTKEKSLKALGYIGHVLRQEAAILAADVVVLDTYCIPASMLPHRRKTKIVQMWHALGAVKKFGWQTVGKEGGSSERTAKLMRMHHGYDYVVCSSDITADYFCEAFGTDREKVVKYGLPRIDLIKSLSRGERQADTAKRIYSKYPQLANTGDKKTILYAPTFRRGRAVDVQSLTDALGTDKYNIVVKLHPLYRGKAGDGAQEQETRPAQGGRENGVLIFDEDFSSNEWLSVADLIISDYSSFVIESTLADKPLFIYAYDMDEYSGSTGLNMDFAAEPIAPYVFKDAAALAESAGRVESYDMEALRAFRGRYIDIETGPEEAGKTAGSGSSNYCTARLADFIESLV